MWLRRICGWICLSFLCSIVSALRSIESRVQCLSLWFEILHQWLTGFTMIALIVLQYIQTYIYICLRLIISKTISNNCKYSHLDWMPLKNIIFNNLAINSFKFPAINYLYAYEIWQQSGQSAAYLSNSRTFTMPCSKWQMKICGNCFCL